MKRIHVHVSIDDLQPPTRFYPILFGAGTAPRGRGTKA
jgi:hypothetical protein